MNESVVDLLEPLRQPTPVPWWPPAPGWWILAVTLLLLLTWGLYLLARYYRRGAPLREARAQLTHLAQTDLDPALLTAELNRLQRRVAIALRGREAAAGLTGDAWAAFLNDLAKGEKNHFDGELVTLAHQAQVTASAGKELLGATREWLSRLERPR